jgi:hypothetical protein
MAEQDILSYRWIGDDAAYIDEPHVERCGDVVIGAYGGASSSGAFKNEDAAWVLCHPAGEWRFAALVDGHYSCESDEAIFAVLDAGKELLIEAMSRPIGVAFEAVRELLLEGFQSDAFREACRGVVGEASAILAAQKGRFVFWISVGDCIGFALHPELGGLGQFAMNQRHFYEWIGKSNVFELDPVPFTSGVQELRTGLNAVALVTDGLYEYPNSPFEDPTAVYGTLGPPQPDLDAGAMRALNTVHRGRGRDSATIVAWQVVVKEPATRSSPAPRPY